jgi:hypothetical protein
MIAPSPPPAALVPLNTAPAAKPTISHRRSRHGVLHGTRRNARGAALALLLLTPLATALDVGSGSELGSTPAEARLASIFALGGRSSHPLARRQAAAHGGLPGPLHYVPLAHAADALGKRQTPNAARPVPIPDDEANDNRFDTSTVAVVSSAVRATSVAAPTQRVPPSSAAASQTRVNLAASDTPSSSVSSSAASSSSTTSSASSSSSSSASSARHSAKASATSSSTPSAPSGDLLHGPNAKFVIAGIAVGGLVALFVLMVLIRSCTHAAMRRAAVREALHGPKAEKLTSDAPLRNGRSLRRALTRRLLEGSIKRREREGTVLLDVGQDVLAVPARVAQEYERERAAHWAAAHAVAGPGRRMPFEPQLALARARARVEQAALAEAGGRAAPESTNVGQWRASLVDEKHEAAPPVPQRSQSISQRLAAGLRGLGGRSRPDGETIDEEAPRSAARIAPGMPGHELKKQRSFDSDSSGASCAEVLQGDASWTIAPRADAAEAGIVDQERALRIRPDAALSHPRISLSDGPAPAPVPKLGRSKTRGGSYRHKAAQPIPASSPAMAIAARINSSTKMGSPRLMQERSQPPLPHVTPRPEKPAPARTEREGNQLPLPPKISP